jgi:hypothetical protein
MAIMSMCSVFRHNLSLSMVIYTAVQSEQVALLDLCAAVLLTTSGHSPVVKPIWPSVPSSLGTLGGKET